MTSDVLTKEYPLGYEAVCTEISENELSESLALKVYRFSILKNGREIKSVNTFDTENDINEKVKAVIEENETGKAKKYAIGKLSGENSPPWQRTKMARNPISDKSKLLSSLTDEGNAVRFEKECEGWLIYDTSSKEWFSWNENHYEKAGDKFGRAMRFVGKSIAEEAEICEKESENDSLNTDLKKIAIEVRNFANQSMNYFRQNAVRKMLESSAMQVDLEKSANTEWITFRNGAVNTKTGELLEIWECSKLKNLYPMIYIDRVYTKNATAPKFNKLLSDVFDDNTTHNLSDEDRFARKVALGRYFKRVMGYALSDGNPEQIILFIYGNGSNGKSTVIDYLRFVLGDEICEASVKELYVSCEDRPASGISEALSHRILLFSEASDDSDDNRGGRISRDTIKALTGDEYTSRFRKMYAKSKQQRIVCLPIGVTNELPNFDKELDSALLRRVVTVPFPHKFAEGDRVKNLKDVLHSEADLVFSVLIDELIAYISCGLLSLPEFCSRAQSELLAGFEVYGFVDSCLEKTDGSVRMSRADVEEAYIAFCDVNEIDVPLRSVVVPGYSDDYGMMNRRQALTEKEKRRLFKGLRVMGIEEYRCMSNRYFNCKRRQN